jgi:hypothetical protein
MVAAIKPDRAVRDQIVARHWSHIWPLEAFHPEKLAEIMADVDADVPPPKWWSMGGGQTIARAWLEWHWHRGISPFYPKHRQSVSPRIRRLVIERDGHVCQLCGGAVEPDDIHLDHIQPYSLGGPTTVENLRVTHSRCNIKRGAAWPASA